MGQIIGNIGLLNIVNATEESINGIERVSNVGMILYSSETAKYVSKLNIGNLGGSILVDGEIKYSSGMFDLDASYLENIKEPVTVIVSGALIVRDDVTMEMLRECRSSFVVSGAIYTPSKLKGAVQSVITKLSGAVFEYKGSRPIPHVGKLNLTNAYLQSLSENETLIVSGKLTLDKQLDLDLFNEKIDRIDITGVAYVLENQEMDFSKKAMVIGKTIVIPSDYQLMTKELRLNNRSIKRFKQQSILATKPLILDKDVTRDAFISAFDSIDSSSYIICHQEIEDLVYERLKQFETEVYVFGEEIRMIGDEIWSEEDFQFLEPSTTLIVTDSWKIEGDLNDFTLLDSISKIELLGDIEISTSKLKAHLQKKINTFKGEIREPQKESDDKILDNIGELTL
ncbi:hypothetical protein [Alkalihalobacillus sp. 1P02AB]|uniref:hypothetical protein n=1 Tax=Alkalihalobacillus sp. 1P02AB TaxID=3132260 RepID=UPI0039A41C32